MITKRKPILGQLTALAFLTFAGLTLSAQAALAVQFIRSTRATNAAMGSHTAAAALMGLRTSNLSLINPHVNFQLNAIGTSLLSDKTIGAMQASPIAADPALPAARAFAAQSPTHESIGTIAPESGLSLRDKVASPLQAGNAALKTLSETKGRVDGAMKAFGSPDGALGQTFDNSNLADASPAPVTASQNSVKDAVVKIYDYLDQEAAGKLSQAEIDDMAAQFEFLFTSYDIPLELMIGGIQGISDATLLVFKKNPAGRNVTALISAAEKVRAKAAVVKINVYNEMESSARIEQNFIDDMAAQFQFLLAMPNVLVEFLGHIEGISIVARDLFKNNPAGRDVAELVSAAEKLRAKVASL